MKIVKVSAIALCSLLFIAATKGTEVSQAQIGQFQIGTANVLDVEGKLGQPQRSGPTSDGGTALDYILMDESPNAASFVPLARLAAGAIISTKCVSNFSLMPLATSQRSRPSRGIWSAPTRPAARIS